MMSVAGSTTPNMLNGNVFTPDHHVFDAIYPT
jgi:hypothetical protein